MEKFDLAAQLLFGPTLPEFRLPRSPVAVIAVPFNCYLRGERPDDSNAMIAEIVSDYMRVYDIPFVGQWEHTNLLRAKGLPVLAEFSSKNGERIESQRLIQFQAETILRRGEGNSVVLVGMLEHLGRCVALCRYFGLDPTVPDVCKEVPYDSGYRNGEQLWCTEKAIFLPYERFIARPGTVARLFFGYF